MPSKLSIIIPTYNEASRVGTTLEQINQYIDAQSGITAEIIISDDGSRDNTLAIASQILGGRPHQIITTRMNRGKGHAIRQGVEAANGDIILFTDADLSTPIEEATKCIERMNDYHIVIGSRALAASNITQYQPLYRQLMGKLFNSMVTFMYGLAIKDTQCGFKCFRADAAKKIFQQQQINRFAFDVEVVFLAKQMGYSLLEMPVTWKNSEQSKVNALRDSTKMFLDLMRIRWYHRGFTKGPVFTE